MEAFTFLNYWKGPKDPVFITRATTHDDNEYEDDGPFFDLDFTLPDNNNSSATTSTDSDSENDSNPSLSVSPPPSSDDLFCLTEPYNSKPPFPTSLLRSATKFRVLSFAFNKSKLLRDSPGPKNNYSNIDNNKQSTANNNGKSSTVKFKVEEVPIVSLFSKSSSKSSKQPEYFSGGRGGATEAAEEKMLTKDGVNKYLKKVKPLYIRVSKRYSGFSGQLMRPNSDVNEQRQGRGLPGVGCKHLGKSRSASSAALPPSTMARGSGGLERRRDDSLLVQQDGIQSAILHCKRSFNASCGKNRIN